VLDRWLHRGALPRPERTIIARTRIEIEIGGWHSAARCVECSLPGWRRPWTLRGTVLLDPFAQRCGLWRSDRRGRHDSGLVSSRYLDERAWCNGDLLIGAVLTRRAGIFAPKRWWMSDLVRRIETRFGDPLMWRSIRGRCIAPPAAKTHFTTDPVVTNSRRPALRRRQHARGAVPYHLPRKPCVSVPLPTSSALRPRPLEAVTEGLNCSQAQHRRRKRFCHPRRRQGPGGAHRHRLACLPLNS